MNLNTMLKFGANLISMYRGNGAHTRTHAHTHAHTHTHTGQTPVVPPRTQSYVPYRKSNSTAEMMLKMSVT